MKKLLLSGGVLGLFLLYGWHQKQEAAGIQLVSPSGNNPANTLQTQQAPTIDQSQQTVNPQPTTAPTTSVSQGQYKDGSYTGSVADAFYGNIQVQVTISGGKISNIQFLQAPNDRGTSIMINQQADPMLAQEAISAQGANVDIVSGATDSSQAFIQSLQSALNQAKG
ncbi:MAG: FMN-binding protein [Patescibacteria group bacterium]|nr:FMN-binding protein [Patescibacteria group bacterium]MDE2589975.1 FMN-binding protein [Patescibacteria group bacterium]